MMKSPFLLCAVFGSAILASLAAPIAPSSNITPIDSRVIKVSPTTFALGDKVIVTVNSLSNLMTAAHQLSRPIVLFVDGKELEDVTPTGMSLELDALAFQLKRTVANKAVWTPLLRNPIRNSVRPLIISVGIKGELPLLVDSSARDTQLTVIEWNWWTITWVILFIALIVVFLLLAIFSDVLKSPELYDGRYPFSLSRTQAAFWLFITAMSFAFIWVVTGDLSTLSGNVLALIGISAATFLSAAMIETSPPKPNVPATGPPTDTAAAPGNVQNIVTRIQNIRFIGRFLADILSDNKGVSIPRFQIFIWTIVLGIIFVVSVVNDLSMPEFSGTLLGLMGISSATYVGAKLSQ